MKGAPSTTISAVTIEPVGIGSRHKVHMDMQVDAAATGLGKPVIASAPVSTTSETTLARAAADLASVLYRKDSTVKLSPDFDVRPKFPMGALRAPDDTFLSDAEEAARRARLRREKEIWEEQSREDSARFVRMLLAAKEMIAANQARALDAERLAAEIPAYVHAQDEKKALQATPQAKPAPINQPMRMRL